MAVKPNSTALWVTANTPSATCTEVVPISDTAMKAGKPITFSPGPDAGPAPLVYSPYTMNLYAASALGTGTEVLIHSGRVGRVIPFAFKDAHGTARLAISPDGKTLYAFGTEPARTVTTVTPISLVTGKAGPPVTVGQGPQAILFSPDSQTAYVVSTGAGPKVSVAAKITPISTVTGQGAPAINLGPKATNMPASIMPGGAKPYISARWAGHHPSTVFSVLTATKTILSKCGGATRAPSRSPRTARRPSSSTASLVWAPARSCP